MADWRQVFQNNPELQRFVLPRVRPTGRELGRGAYGSVEELEVNGLVCAGKRLYEVFLEDGNADVENIVHRYQEECQMMADMRHPHIVQFLGLCYLEGSTPPVLVMEQLDSNLDNLLETTPSIPLTLKQSLLTDVARGLLYLHTFNPPIVHRDLSARNVLLTSSLVAKISDLGCARIVNLRPGQLARLTRIPGTQVYMPPEAFYDPPQYGPQLDIFSFGHLALFTITQIFPGTLLHNTYPDPDNPRRPLARCEVERRRDYIQLLHRQLGEQHPLVQLVYQCLQDDPAERPSAEELLERLEAVRPQGAYGSVKMEIGKLQVAMMSVLRVENEEDRGRLLVQVQTKEEQLQQRSTELQERAGQIIRQQGELQTLREERGRLQAEMEAKDNQLRQKDDQLQHKDDQLQHKDDQLQQKDDQLQQKDDQLQQKDDQLQQKDDQLQQRDDQLQQKDDQLQQKDDQLQQKDDQLQQKDDQLQHKDDQLQQQGTELREKTAQINRQQEELNTLMEDRRRLQAEVEAKNVLLQQKHGQVQQKDVQLQQQVTELQEKTAEINRQQRELKTLREEKGRLQSEMEARNDRQQSELQTLKEERGRLQTELEAMAAENGRQQKELQTLKQCGRQQTLAVIPHARVQQHRRVVMSKCLTCEELNRKVQDLQKDNQKLAEKYADKAADMRDLEARALLVKEQNSKLKQQLKHKEDEVKRLKSQRSGTMWTELQQTKAELAKVRSEASSKTCCKDKELEIQRLKQELTWATTEIHQKVEALDQCRAQLKRLESMNEELTKEVERNDMDELQEENRKLVQQLKQKEDEITKLESEHCVKKECLEMWCELQQKKAEIVNLNSNPCCKPSCIQKNVKYEEKLSQLKQELKHKEGEIRRVHSEASSKTCCKDKELEVQRLKQELTRLNDKHCMRSDCAKVRSDNQALQLEVSQLKSEPCTKIKCRTVTSERTILQTQCNLLHIQLNVGQREIAALKEKLIKDETWATAEVHQKVEALDQCRAQLKRLESMNEELTKEVERLLSERAEFTTEIESSGQCQRPECVKEHREKQVQQIGRKGNPGKDMDKQRVVEHDQLIQEFEELTTDPDGLLGVLEDVLHDEYGDKASFEAKRLLCALFQKSYDSCKKAVIHAVRAQLESLFAVQPTKTEEIEDASRGFGLLLHAFGLRTKEMRDQYSAQLKAKMYSDISSNETLQKVKETLDSSREDHLGKVIALTWKFVTLPNPLIVYQPKKFDPQIHELEFGFWDRRAKELPLIYTRPVVYRDHEGVLACKGWVANIATGQQRVAECVLS